MRRLPDTELVPLVRAGSPEAATVLFDRYWSSAWKAAYAVTANRALADDAAQEAMERAFAALDRFDETRPFGPWLKRIAVNRAIDHVRQRWRVEPVPEERAVLHPWSVSVSDDDDCLWAVTDAVGALAEGRRIVVVLHYWLDLPLDEIAGILGLPVGTVASRLARAKAELRRSLDEAGHVV